jgi:di- and tripeptidase
MTLAKTLTSSDDGVLTMIHIDSLLYTGCISGTVNLWDLDTMQQIRSVRAHQTDVLSLSGIGGFAFSGSAKGYLKKWDLIRGFECVNQWQAHSGTVLSSAIGGTNLITGGNDCYLSVWDISACIPSEQKEDPGNGRLI